MITLYIVGFVFALVGIVLLFSLKYVESTSGKTLLPRARQTLNFRALGIRRAILLVVHTIEHFPAFMVAFSYATLHFLAVLVALGARTAEYQAHRVADFVSHKRKFQRRETQSTFLKEVTSHKETLIVPDEITKV